MSERIMNIALPEMAAVLPSTGDGKTRKSPATRIYQFPPRADKHRGDEKMDDTAEEFAHPSLIIEVAAAVLAFAMWMVWRVTHLSAASR